VKTPWALEDLNSDLFHVKKVIGLSNPVVATHASDVSMHTPSPASLQADERKSVSRPKIDL
jgi:hypothetical protein